MVQTKYTRDHKRAESRLRTFIRTRTAAVIADYVRAQAQCTAIFTKVVLATTETSATTNAMNYPLDSAERLMNAAGQMQ